MIRQNVCQPEAPSVWAACSCSSPTSRSVGITSRATNGTETKIVASTIAGSANSTWIPCAGEPAAEPARPPVEQEEREADDDGGERERQVDERVHEALAREAPAHDREPADDTEDGVQRHGDRDRDQRDLERVDRVGILSASHALPSVLGERPPEDASRAARAGSRQVAERDERSADLLRTLVPRREAPDPADREQDEERDREQHDRDGGRAASSCRSGSG